MNHAADIVFGWNATYVAASILVAMYAFIIADRINAMIVAMISAGLMIFLGVLNQELAIEGIDFNTLFLLIGMMVIVGITQRTGVFQFAAIVAAKSVKANPRALLAILTLITAVFSALLDNVTTVMLIVPITLLLTEQLKIKPYPFLFAQIFASNIGGTATLIGDPPNILIGSAQGYSFMDFVVNLGPVVAVILAVVVLFFDLIWGRKFKTSTRARAHLLRYDPWEALEDKILLYKSLFVLGLVLFGFIWGHGQGYEPGSVALFAAALLMLIDCLGHDQDTQVKRIHKAFGTVEWETIFFFLGLFIVVTGVESTGLLNMVAEKTIALTEGDIRNTGILMIWVSAIVSLVVNNIPFVATMIPVIEAMTPEMGGTEAVEPIWWALALGTCLGGNGSLIGASANVMVASYAARAGERISFIGFMKLAFPLTMLTIAIATVYLLFRYF